MQRNVTNGLQRRFFQRNSSERNSKAESYAVTNKKTVQEVEFFLMRFLSN